MRRALGFIILLLIGSATGCSLLPSLSADRPPTAVIAAEPTRGHAPLTVMLDGSGSYDDGEITAYRWTVEGSSGEPLDGARAELTLTASGDHTVRLTVTDDTGHRDTAQITVHLENRPPLASCRFSSDAPVVGEWILFDASASYDPDGQLVDFVWAFGDGTSTRGTRVGHSYEEIGVYTVQLTIEDDAGATASIDHSFTVHRGGGGGGCGGGGSVCLDAS